MSGIITLQSSNSRSRVQIAPALGFNAFVFEADFDGQLIDVIDADPAFQAGGLRPSGHGIPLLFPFPNRIRGGRFSWDGVDYHLPHERVLYDKTGNAIHGLCLDRIWRVVELGTDFATGEFQLSVDAPDRIDLWPADFRLRATYRLSGTRLHFELEIHNPDTRPLPWGFGTHSYFRLPLGSAGRKEACLIEVPTARQWVLEANLPTGARIPLPESLAELPVGEYVDVLKLDDAFEGWTTSGPVIRTAILDEQAGLQLEQTFPREFGHVVLFTPPQRDAVCIEPYTCTTDAVNLPTGISGWRVLPPGETARLWIDLAVSAVVA